MPPTPWPSLPSTLGCRSSSSAGGRCSRSLPPRAPPKYLHRQSPSPARRRRLVDFEEPPHPRGSPPRPSDRDRQPCSVSTQHSWSDSFSPFQLELADPLSNVRRTNGSSREVEVALDVRVALVQGIDQEKADVFIWQNHFVLVTFLMAWSRLLKKGLCPSSLPRRRWYDICQ